MKWADPVVSAVSAGCHKEKDVLTGSTTSEMAHKAISQLSYGEDYEDTLFCHTLHRSKPAAKGITAGLDGVKTVKHELQVVAPSTSDAVEEKDEAITARVKAHFAKDAHLKNAEIDVQTNAGVVSLTGEVGNLMTSVQAAYTAWQVPGVKAAKNDLTVK